eukprot:scaffold11490_cov135-Isochrysis_galbana.AAC.3
MVASKTLTSSCSVKRRCRPTHATASSNSAVRFMRWSVSSESTRVSPMPQECRALGTTGSSSSAPQATDEYPRHACSIAARTAACRSGCRSCASRNGRRRPAKSVALGPRGGGGPVGCAGG